MEFKQKMTDPFGLNGKKRKISDVLRDIVIVDEDNFDMQGISDYINYLEGIIEKIENTSAGRIILTEITKGKWKLPPLKEVRTVWRQNTDYFHNVGNIKF